MFDEHLIYVWYQACSSEPHRCGVKGLYEDKWSYTVSHICAQNLETLWSSIWHEQCQWELTVQLMGSNTWWKSKEEGKLGKCGDRAGARVMAHV